MTVRPRPSRAARPFALRLSALARWLLALLVCIGCIRPAQAEADALAEALDQPSLKVSTSGAATWFAQAAFTHDGIDALQSGPAGDNQSTSVSVTFTGKASVSFRWKVSSERNYDFLRFFIDGVEQAEPISGEVDWQEQNHEITAGGSHTLKWSYIKDHSSRSGSDAAWLDELIVQKHKATAPPLIRQLAAGDVAFGEPAALMVYATGGALSFQWYRGATGDTSSPVVGATRPALLTPPLASDASFWVRVENSLGSADSATANIGLIRSGHGLMGMGSTHFGQLAIGVSNGTPLAVEALLGITQVATGRTHTLFVKTDGSLWAVGNNEYGQLGDGTRVSRTAPVRIASDVRQAAAGSSHSLFLKTDGSLWAMGANHHGQLGGTFDTPDTPIQIASDVAQVAAGYDRTAFIKTDSSLWVSAVTYNQAPAQVAAGVSRITIGGDHVLFIKTDDTLWGMGSNAYGQLGDGPPPNHDIPPTQIASDVAQAAAGGSHSLFVKTDGSLWATGSNHYGQFGNGQSSSSTTVGTPPVQVASDIASVAAGGSHSLFTKNDGSLWAMGKNVYEQLGDGSSVQRPTPVQVDSDVARFVAGENHGFFFKTDGTLWAMGGNDHGQLGVSKSTVRATPVPVAHAIMQAAAGTAHSLFIDEDGSLWAAGDNASGQLGDGSLLPRRSPVKTASDVVQAAAGRGHSLFIKTDGSLWAVGSNYAGQLGDGSLADRAIPVRVASDVVLVAAGNAHSLFLKTDGTLWAMGANSEGQLGDGTFLPRALPAQIASDVVRIAAGAEHSMFVKTDGTLRVMGANGSGQLGDGYTFHQNQPILAATQVAQVAAGENHSLFVKTDGSLWGMGANFFGQLGENRAGHAQTAPIQFATDVARIVAGDGYSLFIKSDTSLWALGRNDVGQLGDGSSGRYETPVAVRIATGVVSAAAGATHGFFIQAPVHAVVFDPGSLGTATGGGSLTQTVIDGRAAIEPLVSPISPDWNFLGWDKAFDHITGDITVQAIYRRRQSIGFEVPAIHDLGASGTDTLVLAPSASSGLPATVEIVSGPATLGEDGRTLTFTGFTGTVVLRVTQPGDETWAAALPVEVRFTVKGPGGEAQRISFPAPAARIYGDAPFVLAASSSAALPVNFEIVSGPASLEHDTLTITGVGRVVLKATQAGGKGFDPASAVTRVFLVGKAPLTVGVAPAFRFVGELNPAFVLTYSGFVGPDADNEAAAIAGLDRRPVARTQASRRSPQGDYPVTVSGGADDHYKFIPLQPAGILTVRGFGGTYEVLLEAGVYPAGKLTLTIAENGFSYTGVLRLARAAGPIAVSSTSRTLGTTAFVPEDISSASATWTRTVPGLGSVSIPLTVDSDGHLWAELFIGAEQVAVSGEGGRLRTAATDASWSGRHTLTLSPGAGRTRLRPAGYGYASVSMAPRTGVLTLAGKLADGSPLTASLRPDESGTCHLWSNPYGTRTGSYLAGRLFDDFHVALLFWEKAALPGSTPAAKRDKSYRAGFGPLGLLVDVDPWLPPVNKATASGPAVTLLQRLGLASENAGPAEIIVSHATDDDSLDDFLSGSASALPELVTLSAEGKITVEAPNATNWKLRSLNPTTGAFTGSFVLIDPTPTDANPDKTTKRSLSFSGTLRQRDGDDPLVGAGFFLLPPPPGSESDEQISGEILFKVLPSTL